MNSLHRWRRGVLLALVVLGAATPAIGQRPDPPNPRARQMLEDRFAQHIQRELNLTDEQSARVRRVLTASAERRRATENEERQAHRALRDQLRPGVAAQTDSVVRLLDRLTALRVAFAQAARDEIQELGAVLTPVQQAQYLIIRDRLQAAAQGIRWQRGARTPRDSGSR